jgi:nucleoid DNA-binding protein
MKNHEFVRLWAQRADLAEGRATELITKLLGCIVAVARVDPEGLQLDGFGKFTCKVLKAGGPRKGERQPRKLLRFHSSMTLNARLTEDIRPRREGLTD